MASDLPRWALWCAAAAALAAGGAAVLALASRPPAATPAQQTVADDAGYPEGALWHGDALYWAEMTEDRVMRWDGRAASTFWTHDDCGPTAIAPAAGGFAVACHRADMVVRLDAEGRTRETVTTDTDGAPVRWPNDMTGDRQGGVYLSSSGRFAVGAPATGRLLYLPPDGPPRVVAEGLYYANGVALSRDGRTLYAAEHIGRRVLAFEVTAPGSLGASRDFADFEALPSSDSSYSLTGPDGIDVALDGRVLVAEYGAGRIAVFGADGAFEGLIAVPERFVTSSSFGPDGALFTTGATALTGGARGAVRRLEWR